MATLCNYGANHDAGCSQDPDAAGEYDVVMPEPHRADVDTEESQYKVRVTSGGAAGCSEAFRLLPLELAPQPGDMDGPFLEVISPMEGDGAVAGQDYTVEVCIICMFERRGVVVDCVVVRSLLVVASTAPTQQGGGVRAYYCVGGAGKFLGVCNYLGHPSCVLDEPSLFPKRE